MKPSIEKRISIEGDPVILFNALTTGKEIIKFFPIKEAWIGNSVGQSIILKGDGFEDIGVITKFEEGVCFEYSYWSTNHQVPNVPDNQVVITYEIESEENVVHLSVKQRNLHSVQMRNMMDEVWDFLLRSLKKFIEDN